MWRKRLSERKVTMAQIPFTNGSCPNCGKRISDYGQNKYLYGSPIRYCKKCKGAYVDRNYHEIAVDGFPKTEMKASTGLKSALMGLVITVVSAGIFILEICFSDRYHTIFPILAVMGIVMIIIGIVDSIRVKSGAKADSMEKMRQESIQRLSDQRYAVQLKELGYNVPEQYLPEGYQPPMPQAYPQGFPQGIPQGIQQGMQQFNQQGVPQQASNYQQQAQQPFAKPAQQPDQNEADNIQQ